MIEIDDRMMVEDIASSLFWFSDLYSDSQTFKHEIAQQLYAQMVGWA
jgi:hypothetical protein